MRSSATPARWAASYEQRMTAAPWSTSMLAHIRFTYGNTTIRLSGATVRISSGEYSVCDHPTSDATGDGGGKRRCAREAGRNPDEISFACCLPIELTPKETPQEENYLKGNIHQVTAAIKKFQQVGVTHMGLQFMIPHYPERQEQIERFAKEALPALRG